MAVRCFVGEQSMDSKHISDSQVILAQFMQPEHANAQGNVHGGVHYEIDRRGGRPVCHAPCAPPGGDGGGRFAALSVAGACGRFRHVHGASQLDVGRTSMEVEVNVEAENLLTGQKTHTNSAYLVFVALDQEGRPVEVPGLILETEEERRRWMQGAQRQADRLSRAKREARMNEPIKYHAAGGVVIRENGRKMLLLEVAGRKELRLPKGHIEDGETVEQAAVREVQEETGYADVEIIDDLGSVTHTFYNFRKDANITRTESYFLMRLQQRAALRRPAVRARTL